MYSFIAFDVGLLKTLYTGRPVVFHATQRMSSIAQVCHRNIKKTHRNEIE